MFTASHALHKEVPNNSRRFLQCDVPFLGQDLLINFTEDFIEWIAEYGRCVTVFISRNLAGRERVKTAGLADYRQK